MASKVYGVADSLHGQLLIEVECQTSQGLPGMTVVGMATKSIDEAKDRLRSAFHSSGLTMPKKKIILNLVPADTQKEGTGLDLALAAAIITEHTVLKPRQEHSSTVYFGEVGLDGIIRPVRGLIGKLLVASSQNKQKITHALVPECQQEQAALIDGITIVACNTLKDLYEWLYGESYKSVPAADLSDKKSDVRFEVLLEDIAGHELAKRALEISVAGGHNMLLNGPPGTGKTMIAKAAPSLLPSLTKKEILELTNLHSLVGLAQEKLIMSPPFRSPHHSASTVAIIGGGQRVQPGEISLASHGILLLDELPEFHRDCLEALRQPLEDGIVHVSRAKSTVSYPASFMLIATKNPCPCGHYGSSKACTCSAFDIQRYNKKLSGPILDRIDTYVDVEEIPYVQLGIKNSTSSQTSEKVRDRIIAARKRQRDRNPSSKLNARLSLKEMLGMNMLGSDTTHFIAAAAEKLGMSGRGYVRTLRLSHTIADLEGAELVETRHATEALQLRPKQQR